jgi:hypothetical protein
MKPANLDFLFSNLIGDFVHLLSIEQTSKKDFADIVRGSSNTGKTALFYQSILRSNFDTIRISADKNEVLFNS